MKNQGLSSFQIFMPLVCFLILGACSTRPILKMPPSPTYVREYKHLTVRAAHPGMVDTGIFLNQGDRYLICATGRVKLRHQREVGPSRLYARVGNNLYLPAVAPGSNAGLYRSKYSGQLRLGVLDGGFNENGHAFVPDRYLDNSGRFSVDIIVWQSDDLLQIEKSLTDLEESNQGRKLHLNLKKHIIEMKFSAADEILETKLPGASNQQAIQYLSKAIGYCPGYAKLYDAIGLIYVKENQKEKAIDALIKASQLGSRNPEALYLLSQMLYRTGQTNDAYKYINAALEIKNDFPDAAMLKEKIKRASNLDGPRIVLFEPPPRRGIKIVHQRENMTVRGVAIDKDGLAWVKVNQQPLTVDKRGNFLKDVPIQIGSNRIYVEAADGLGNRSSLTVEVEGERYALPVISRIESSSQMAKLYTHSYAVIIGINRYQKWPALEYAVPDAEAIKKKLENSGFDQVTTILDEEATKRRILTELFDELPRKVEREDRVVFYFAGHGQTEDLKDGAKRGYIIPADADPSDSAATAISMEQIKDLSREISAKHILFVMDSCYSGLGLNRSSGLSSQVSDYLRKVSAKRAVQIITAGGKGEQAQEKNGHGLFTTYFLKALEGEADFNQDNVVSGTELGAYLRPTVSNASYQAQTPLYGTLEGEGEFLFYVGK